MERAERIILLCFGLLFSSILVPILWVMLVLTAHHRRAAVRQGVAAGGGRARHRGPSGAAPKPTEVARRIARSHRMTQVRVKRRPQA